MDKVCSNFMNLEEIQKTVADQEKIWGAPGDPPRVITEFGMAENCMI